MERTERIGGWSSKPGTLKIWGMLKIYPTFVQKKESNLPNILQK